MNRAQYRRRWQAHVRRLHLEQPDPFDIDQLINVCSSIASVAALTTIVMRRNKARTLDAIGSSFRDAIAASLGKGVTFP